MNTQIGVKGTTFYEQIQNCRGLDLRDNRGKIHNMALVLVGLAIGLLRKRDGNLSSLHRSMLHTHGVFCNFLGLGDQLVVSRSHLPIILKKVNLLAFQSLLFATYGVELSGTEKQWFAGDGKDLRGSIKKGDTRGQALVLLVRHSDQEVLGQDHYNGQKESERPCLRDLILTTGALRQKITMDALHLCPATTGPIAENGGIFLIGLKENQANLLADMTKAATYLSAVDQMATLEKGHGRIEERKYFHYDISQQYFDARWGKSNFKSLFKVERSRTMLKTGQQTTEIAYYISNGAKEENEDFFGAIRGHWQIEVSNHIRDVTFQEDKFRTIKDTNTKVMSGLRTLVINMLHYMKPKNLAAQLDFFQDNFSALLSWLRSIKFL